MTDKEILNLAQAELRAMYKRLGINGSNVLNLIDEALSRPPVIGQFEAIRTDFCLWYYAQSQPLDAHKVVDWFASNLR